MKNTRKIIFIVLIIGLLVYTFICDNPGRICQIERDAKAVSIAISELKFGLSGYTGYQNILMHFGQHSDIAIDNAVVNAGIENVLKMDADSAASGGVHYLYGRTGDDVGIVDFYKLAFLIFGYRAESIYYLFCLILSAVVFIYILTFHDRPALLHILLLFVCSYLAIMKNQNTLYETVTNSRFFPILSIPSALYLAFLTIGEKRINFKVLIGMLSQVTILLFVIHARLTAAHQLVFLGSTAAIVFVSRFLYLKHHRASMISGREKFRLNFWPLTVTIVGFLLLTSYTKMIMDKSYVGWKTRHPVWLCAYMGIGNHPGGHKYGVPVVSEIYLLDYQEKQTGKRSFNFDNELTDFIRGKFFEILKNNPKFLVENYYYKFKFFLELFFNPQQHMKYFEETIKWYLLAVVIFSTLMVTGVGLMIWLRYLWILILQFMFALFPAMFGFVIGHTIIDAGLMFNVLIYFIFSWVILCILVAGKQVFFRIHPQKEEDNARRVAKTHGFKRWGWTNTDS